MTVLPSPNGVGLTDVTKTKLPCGFENLCFRASQVIFATPRPIGISSVEDIPNFHAIASIGSKVAAFAISKSLAMKCLQLVKALKLTVESWSKPAIRQPLVGCQMQSVLVFVHASKIIWQVYTSHLSDIMNRR